MKNASRNLHATLFSCLVQLFNFSVVLLFFLATFMVNKDEYSVFGTDMNMSPFSKSQSNRDHLDQPNPTQYRRNGHIDLI